MIRKAKVNESVNMTFRLPKDLADELKKSCNKQDVTANSVIIELIRSFLSELEK